MLPTGVRTAHSAIGITEVCSYVAIDEAAHIWYHKKMNVKPMSAAGSLQLNMKTLSAYLAAGVILATAGLLCVSLDRHFYYALVLLGLPIAVLIVTNPRLALYQYVFVLFIEHALVPSVPLYLADFSAVLVILAALLDILLSDRLPRYLPRLSFNYLYLITALVVCGFVGYWPELAIRQVVSLGLLFATFLALYRLTARVSVSELVNWFFVLAVLHSAWVLVPFVAAGGHYRSFGFTPAIFGHLAEVALPVGLALYIGAAQRRVTYYYIGTVIILLGLTATQSRAPIAFGLTASLFVLLVAHSRIKGIAGPNKSAHSVKRRIKVVVWSGIVLAVLVMTLKSSILEAVLGRFDELLSLEPQGTMFLRLVLWKKALTAFLDHPVFGIGPGGYKHLHEIYTSFRLAPTSIFLQSMTAHNLLFHYLAETGLVGAAGLVALLVNLFRLARRSWLRLGDQLHGSTLAMYGCAFVFALSTLIDAAWMYGQLGFTAVFFAAAVSRQHFSGSDYHPA